MLPTLERPFEKVRLVEKEVIYPQIEAKLELVMARAPERLATFVLVVARLLLVALRLVLVTVRLLLVTLRFPDNEERVALVVARFEFVVLRLLLSLLKLLERRVMLAPSIERRSNIVEKILENAPCKLASSGAESNSMVHPLPLIILIDFFQS